MDGPTSVNRPSFNRILGRRHAIVSEVAGTTRDRLMSEAQWDDRRFILVDTGGLESNPEGAIREKVQEQADMALFSADVIVFVTDVMEGLTHADEDVAQRLRRTDKPVILAVNKSDNDNRELGSPEFFRLGLTDPLPISAYHNFGIYELMDRIISHFPPEPDQPESDEESPEEAAPQARPSPPASGELKLAIVGRTNVGKSMLLNAILGQERSIVSQTAGTTRDALDTNLAYGGRDLVIIDTAGIRRPGQVQRGIEKYSVIRAVSAVNRSDITLLVTDASELATAQDAHIAGLAWEMCRGLIVVVNKWDLAEEDDRASRARAVARVQERLHFMSYVPICFTSALNAQGIDELMQTALDLWKERLRFVPSRELAVHAGRRPGQPRSTSGKAAAQQAAAHHPSQTSRRKSADVRVRRRQSQAGTLYLPAVPGEPAPDHLRFRPHPPEAAVQKAMNKVFTPLVFVLVVLPALAAATVVVFLMMEDQGLVARYAAVLALAYLLGSVPWGYLLLRLRLGVDVREFGSGRTGMSNVLRTGGGKVAGLVLVLDVAKGILSVMLAREVIGTTTGEVAAGLASLIGHNWPVFLQFRGGRGILTGLGSLSVMAPIAGGAAAATFLIGTKASRYVSLGNILGVIASGVSLLALWLVADRSGIYVFYGLFGGLIILWQHRDNIKRIREGNERKLGQPAAPVS